MQRVCGVYRLARRLPQGPRQAPHGLTACHHDQRQRGHSGHMDSRISHPVFAAVYDPVTWLAERTLLRPHREYLVDDLEGRVLDLGAGTGAMFPYFVTGQPPKLDVHAVEPDRHMLAQAKQRATGLTLDIATTAARAEALPYPDESFDAVVAAMVFCTIPDPGAALAEVRRVLKPTGEVRFLEHVAATGWQRRLQSAVAPVWRRIAGGCHLTRESVATFTSASGLEVTEIDRLRTGVPPVRPFVRGRLRRF